MEHVQQNAAQALGYTEAYYAASQAGELAILVQPDADLGDRLKAWDLDEQEFVTLTGWLWEFEPL